MTRFLVTLGFRTMGHSDCLRVGIVGLGVGEKHIEAYQSHPNCQVVAVCDFVQEKMAAVSKKCHGIEAVRHADDILNAPDIDVVSIASYDNFHYEQIVRGIANGKAMFVEKPLVLHVEEAVKIRERMRTNPDIKLSCNLNLRTVPRFIRMKEAIQAGEMGQVFYMEGDYLWGRIHKLTSGWRKDMDFYSIVHGAGVHMVDLLMWMMEMRPVEVVGYGSQIATSGTGSRHNDFAAILMKFEDGMIAKVSASGGVVHPHFHRVAVFGTKKTFFNDIWGGRLIDSRDKEEEISQVVEEYPAVDRKGEVITTFINFLLDPESKPMVSCDDVFASLSVCLAAEESIQKGDPVSVEYI